MYFSFSSSAAQWERHVDPTKRNWLNHLRPTASIIFRRNKSQWHMQICIWDSPKWITQCVWTESNHAACLYRHPIEHHLFWNASYLLSFPSRLLSLISFFQHPPAFHFPPLTCWTSWQRQQGFASLQQEHNFSSQHNLHKRNQNSVLPLHLPSLILIGEIIVPWIFTMPRCIHQDTKNHGTFRQLKGDILLHHWTQTKSKLWSGINLPVPT